MTSDIRLQMLLQFSLSREVDSGNWPDASQGTNGLVAKSTGIDLTLWNDAYAKKIPLAPTDTATIDLRNFEDLLFETGKALDKAFLMGVAAVPTLATALGGMLRVTPGAVNGFAWFFDGLTLKAGRTLMFACDPADTAGDALDGTHKTIDLENTGSDALVATIIVIGGD